MHFKKFRNVAINVVAFFIISTVILHSKVPVGINIDFEVLKAFIGRWFVGNSFLHHDFKVKRNKAVLCLIS